MLDIMTPELLNNVGEYIARYADRMPGENIVFNRRSSYSAIPGQFEQSSSSKLVLFTWLFVACTAVKLMKVA